MTKLKKKSAEIWHSCYVLLVSVQVGHSDAPHFGPLQGLSYQPTLNIYVEIYINIYIFVFFWGGGGLRVRIKKFPNKLHVLGRVYKHRFIYLIYQMVDILTF